MSITWDTLTLKHLCWHSITKILRNGPRAHFPFNLPLFGDLCQSQHKATRTSAKSLQIKLKLILIQFWHIWIILCHHLVCFCKSNSNLYFYVNHTCWGIKRVIPKEIDQRFQKLPLFPIINTSPHKKPTFDERDNARVLNKPKALFYYFQNLSSGSWSISCFGLIFSPFGIKHQNGINLGPLTPLPHQNLQIRTQRQ